MTIVSRPASEIFRDYATDGVPASGAHKPPKSHVRAWGAEVEAALAAAVAAGGGLLYDTRANLFADLAHAANATAWVYADSTAAYNGIYRKSGASGAGSWSRVLDLPYSVLLATVTGGTADAIEATTALPIPSSYECLVILTPTADNTGAVTVALNGGSALALTDADGVALPAGALKNAAKAVLVPGSSGHRLVWRYARPVPIDLTSVGGTGDAITASAVVTPASGELVAFVAGADNTGATTLSVNSETARNLLDHTGAALTRGAILSGGSYVARRFATTYRLVAPAPRPAPIVLTSVGGTANAITGSATVDPAGGDLVQFTATANNTGATTLSVNSETARDVLTAAGAAVARGAILSGSTYLVQRIGTTYRMATATSRPVPAVLTTVGGTGDAITANATIDPVTGDLFELTATADNTGATTLAVNGGTAGNVLTQNGATLARGALRSGRTYLLRRYSTTYRIVGPVDRAAPLPLTSVAGTADAVTSSCGWDPIAGDLVYWTAGATNTGAMTLAVNSDSARTVVDRSGSALHPGTVQSGDLCVAVRLSTSYRLLVGRTFDRPAPLPLTNIGGTAGAITADCTHTPVEGDLVTLQIGTTNVGNTTIAVNGGSAVTILDGRGKALGLAMLRSGRRYLMYRDSAGYRLVTEVAATRLSVDGPLWWDPTGVLNATPSLYVPRKVYAFAGRTVLDTMTSADAGSASSEISTHHRIALGSSTSTYLVYVDPEAATVADVFVATTSTSDFDPTRHVALAEVRGGRVYTPLAVNLVDDRDRVTIIPRGPMIVEDGYLYCPPFFVITGGSLAVKTAADGAYYHKLGAVSNAASSATLTRHLWDPRANAVANIVGTGAPTSPGDNAYGMFGISLDYCISRAAAPVYGRGNNAIAVNEWHLGKSPDLAPFLQSGATVVDVTDSALTALGFTRGVKNATGTGAAAFYGGRLPRRVKSGEFVGVRMYVETSVADNFGANPRLYFRSPTETTTQIATLVLEEKLSSTAAIYSFFGQVTASVPSPFDSWTGFHVGVFNGGTSGHAIVTGVQVAVGRSPVPWIARGSYQDHEHPGISPIFSEHLFAIDGSPLPIYTAGLVERRDWIDRGHVVASIDSAPSSVLVTPTCLDWRDVVEVDSARMGTTADLDVNWTTETSAVRRRVTATIKRGRATASGSPAANILMMGDSLTENGTVDRVKLRLEARSYVPTFVGTRRSRGAVSGALDGPFAEARAGHAINDYLYRGTLDGEEAPVTVGDEATYLALSEASKIGYNPFIIPSVGGEPYIYNAYVWDFGEYLSRFSVTEPDIVCIGLGYNDLNELNDRDEMVGAVGAMVDAMTASIRDVSADIEILYWLPPMPRVVAMDEKWARVMSAGVLELIKKVRALADTKTRIVPVWAHAGGRAWNALAASPAMDADTGIQTASISDQIHPAEAGYQQIANALTAAIASIMDPV